MIPFSKTAAVLAVVICGASAMHARAQESDESRPRPGRAAPRPAPEQRPAEPSPAAEPAESAPPPAPQQPRSSGLSEEAIRSFREWPPKVSVDEEMAPEGTLDTPDEAPARPRPRPSAPANIPQRPEYVVEPPDLLLVEVLEALPGRPISGERLVRPDGRISLGFYGEIPVTGLTLAQIKERIVLHLRKFIADDILGVVETDPETGNIRRDADGSLIVKDPRQTDRVFVDVTGYNSQKYYILGEVVMPGRLPYTGGDTVLDLVQYAGGLLPTADKGRIRLIRTFPKGSPARVLPVNYEEIAMGTDSSTNYAILPNDRLVVPRVAASRPAGDAGLGASDGDRPLRDARTAQASASRSAPTLYYDRGAYEAARRSTAELEQRIAELEKKLDRLIEVVEASRTTPVGGPEEAPAEKLGERRRLRRESEPAAAMEPAPLQGIEDDGRRPRPQPPGPRRAGPGEPRPAMPRRPDREDPDAGPFDLRPARSALPDLPASRSDVLPPQSSPEP